MQTCIYSANTNRNRGEIHCSVSSSGRQGSRLDAIGNESVPGIITNDTSKFYS